MRYIFISIFSFFILTTITISDNAMAQDASQKIVLGYTNYYFEITQNPVNEKCIDLQSDEPPICVKISDFYSNGRYDTWLTLIGRSAWGSQNPILIGTPKTGQLNITVDKFYRTKSGNLEVKYKIVNISRITKSIQGQQVPGFRGELYVEVIGFPKTNSSKSNIPSVQDKNVYTQKQESSSDGPTKKQTTDYILKRIRFDAGKVYYRAKIDNCTLIHTQSGRSESGKYTVTLTIPIDKLNPEKITAHSQEGRYWINIATNDSDKVIRKGTLYSNRAEINMIAAYSIFSKKGDPEKLRKAFIHLITLCGGKGELL